MTNEQFYYALIEYQSAGLVFCRMHTKELYGYKSCKIGKRIIFISNSIPEFFYIVHSMVETGQLLSQRQIELPYGRTHTLSLA